MRSAARQVALPTLQRQATLVPQSLDVDGRTVEVVWTTGARVRRQGFWDDEPWFEELSVADGAVDLSRLNAGAAVLDSHQSSGVRNVLGAVEPKSARLENGHGLARIQFSRRPDVADVIEDIRAGIIRNLSVGYTVDALEEIEQADRKAGTLACFRATRWQPVELSFVAVGADAGAQVRAEAASTQPCLITRRSDMDEETTVVERPKAKRKIIRAAVEAQRPPGEGGEQPGEGEEVPPPAPKQPEDEDEESSAAAARAERKRIQEIRQAVRNGGLPEDFADQFIDEGTPAAAVPKAVLTERARRQAPVSRSVVELGPEGQDRLRAAITSVLLHRVNPTRHKLVPEAERFQGFSVLELARTLLTAQGIRAHGMDRMQLAAVALGVARPDMVREGPHGFLATSDFPTLLAQVARVQLTEGYTATDRTFPPWTRQTTLPDFRITNRASLGLGPRFLPVPEHSEYKRARLALAGVEPMQLEPYGRILAFTRQAMVNDDIGLFQRIPRMFGNAAAQLESDTVYGILTGNPTMADTFALFSTQHANLQTAAQLNVQSLSAARQAMMAQKSPDGQLISVLPRFLIVGPIQELTAAQLLSGIWVPVAPQDVMPTSFQASLKLIVEPRITDTAWYLSADPGQIDTIEYAYLEGAPQGGPVLETREGWDIDGIEYKARMDFDAAPIDFRGLVKNPGLMPTGLQTGLTRGATPAAGGPETTPQPRHKE
jgi:hypothetical protein